MFDLVSMAELTASAVLVITVYAGAFGRSWRERSAIGLAFALWFVLVLRLGANDALHYERGIGVPGLGLAVLLPILILTGLTFATRTGRARLAAAPLPALIAAQGVRVLGVSFVLLHAAGRLPAPFAPVAGWGDILVGALALPVALMVARGTVWAHGSATAWTLLGILDLLAAVGLGVTASPGPLQVFLTEPDSSLMTGLPWIIIPCFLVPSLFSLHLMTLARLRAGSIETTGLARV